jgi:hypothetical protein
MNFFRKTISFNFTFRYLTSVFALVFIISQALKLMGSVAKFPKRVQTS